MGADPAGQRLDEPTEEYARQRELLFAVAYRMLGSVADTEDVLQEVWLSWVAASRDSVENPRAYLVRITVNEALRRLGRAERRHETYAGPWLPEPLVGDDASQRAVAGDQVSIALLVVLETLSPLERAVFVLREAFAYDYEEIARMLGRNPAAVRQVAHRAREHVRAGRSRFSVDTQTRRAVTETFLAASFGADLDVLMEILAPDVTMWTDSGGKVAAARQVVRGRDKVARLIVGTVGKGRLPPVQLRYAVVNGEPGLLVTLDDRLYGVAVVELSADGQQVASIYGVLNPEKLTHIDWTQLGETAPIALP